MPLAFLYNVSSVIHLCGNAKTLGTPFWEDMKYWGTSDLVIVMVDGMPTTVFLSIAHVNSTHGEHFLPIWASSIQLNRPKEVKFQLLNVISATTVNLHLTLSIFNTLGNIWKTMNWSVACLMVALTKQILELFKRIDGEKTIPTKLEISNLKLFINRLSAQFWSLWEMLMLSHLMMHHMTT